MSHIAFLLDVFAEVADRDAIVWRGTTYDYRWLLKAVDEARDLLDRHAVRPGTVVSLEADFSPMAVALFLVLVERGAIVVPLTSSVEAKKPRFREIAEVEVVITVGGDDAVSVVREERGATHPLLGSLREREAPGLVLFSSGSTGESKAALHDLRGILAKFTVRRHALRSIVFLLFDHIGGVNTLLYTLSNGGCIVTVSGRSSDEVCDAIERYKVQLLPTSPTFLNLLLLSEAWKRHDLSTLETITYGTEPMPEATLRRVCEVFPAVKLQQTYGLSELGIMRSKSRGNDSLWVKIGGEGFEWRVVDGLLEIKAQSAMLGYLNAESPWTADGWFRTGDVVEVDGEWVRIHGRQSEIINVGGEKVYPAEVEGVLQLMDGVEDVVVNGERNAITGQLVKARVRLSSGETAAEFRRRMHEFCRTRLRPFQVPQKVELVVQEMHGERFKKMRREA